MFSYEKNENSLTLNQLAFEVNQNAKDKGWYETERTPLEFHMLMVSEIAEATEEVRAKKPELYFNKRPLSYGEVSPGVTTDPSDKSHDGKPEGEAVELADCIIRIADYFAHKGWDMEAIVKMKHEYNKTRSHRHGGKAL